MITRTNWDLVTPRFRHPVLRCKRLLLLLVLLHVKNVTSDYHRVLGGRSLLQKLLFKKAPPFQKMRDTKDNRPTPGAPAQLAMRRHHAPMLQYLRLLLQAVNLLLL